MHYIHYSDELIKAVFFINKGHPLFAYIIVQGVSYTFPVYNTVYGFCICEVPQTEPDTCRHCCRICIP